MGVWYNMLMSLSIQSIGILFNALVCATVAAAALALTLFLLRKRGNLDSAMHAYAWFWWYTVLVWVGSSVRYLIISLGYAGEWINFLDVLIQGTVFFTGPPLIYYATARVFRSARISNVIAITSVLLGIISMWFILQPHGIPVLDVTYFSAEATTNAVSFSIFSLEAGSILILLFVDVARRLQNWRHERSRASVYQALYSMSVIVYLILGSIDESKVMTDWPLIIFRMLYAGSFLMAYLIITQDEASQEEYLVTRDWGMPNARA